MGSSGNPPTPPNPPLTPIGRRRNAGPDSARHLAYAVIDEPHIVDNFSFVGVKPFPETPAVDIAEQENEYEVKVELPGVSKEDVKISLESNILTIKGEKKEEKEEKKTNLHRVERSYGMFQRSFTLPTTVKSDKIDATFSDGVLTITLPKVEEAKPKQIEVKVR